MSIRSIPRSAIGGAVKLTRMPLDVVVSLLPGDGNGGGPGPAAGIAVDRIEATLLDAAGMALGDRELREDATRRRLSADERARALHLRDDAADHSTHAERFPLVDDDLAHPAAEERPAAEDRRAAEQQADAEPERATAERREPQRKATATGTKPTRRTASRKPRSRTGGVAKEDADNVRLEQLEAEAKALEEREAALSAQAATQRDATKPKTKTKPKPARKRS